jgi:hypothetical protein
MNSEQIDKTQMFQTTLLVLTAPANAAITSGFPAFLRSQAAHAGSLNLIAALAQAQGGAIKGITLDKDRLQLSLINRTAIVAGAAGAFAFDSGNQTLAAKFDIKEGTLKNLRDSLIDDAAQVIHDEAAALVTADAAKMAEYKLTPLVLTDLQSAITAYSATVGTPRAAIAGRTGITEAIANEIARADANLKNSLDRLILQFQAEHPNFTTAYAAARKIVTAGGGHSPEPAIVPSAP